MRTATGAVLMALACAVGCGSVESGGAQGSERGACYPNGTCDDGLTCASNLCVVVADDSGTGGTKNGGGLSGGGAGAGGLVGTGGVGNGGTAGAAGSSSPGGSSQGGDTSGTGGVGGVSCTATTLVAQSVTEVRTEYRTETVTTTTPAAIYIMQDQSGSMMQNWPFAVQAVTDFVSDPGSDGLWVAMQWFPFATPTSNCSENTFAVPEVPWGTLGPPGTQNQAIITAMNNHAPFGIGTPLEDALRGVIKGCRDFEAAHAGVECYALLVTDGEPSDCSAANSGVYESVAAQGLADGVPTYTVGMPGVPNFTLLDGIAQAAGTDCNGATAGLTCNASNSAEFLAAINALRESVTGTITVEEQVPYQVTELLDCEWIVPAGEDHDKMTVRHTDLATSVETTLVRVLDPADCTAAGSMAWHYDSEAAPTRLMACPAACDVIKASDAQIDILAGCDVEIFIPR